MKKLLLAMIFSGFVSVPVFADSVNVLFGYAIPRGDSDVYQQNEAETTFRVKDLNDFIGSVGYDHFFGDHISLGGNFAYYQGDTTVQDRVFLYPDGSPLFRDIRLEIVPLEIALKVLPIGRNVPVIPYFGGGGGIYYWQYEEVGNFVINRNIVSGSAYSDGYDPGWHVEGGVQIPVARSIALQFEAKYWQAKGNLDVRGFDPSFHPLDLSGSSYSGGISFWF